MQLIGLSRWRFFGFLAFEISLLIWLMASNFFLRKYAHRFNLLLRNHLDSTLTLRNPQKANLPKKHACAVGGPLPVEVFGLSWPLKYLCFMAFNFFWRKYAHLFNFLLRNHLDSTLILRNPQKANLQKKHACAVGRPLPVEVFWLSWPLKYLCSSGSWHLTSSCASTRTASTSSCATTLTVP